MAGGRRVALLRGINVGKAKRISMAQLRSLVEELGFRDVRTLLNSGNIVFTAAGRGDPAARIEKALAEKIGVSSRVTVLTGEEFATAVVENPLLEVADNHSRLLVGFLADAAEVETLNPLLEKEWTPEALAVGTRVAYLWCPAGVLESPLGDALNRALRDRVTVRNWATVTKLLALVRGDGDDRDDGK
jgi:uncharacterized protein (DUF1697 family)